MSEVTSAATEPMFGLTIVLTLMAIFGTIGALIQMLIHTQVPQEQDARQAIQAAIRGGHLLTPIPVTPIPVTPIPVTLFRATLIRATIALGGRFGAGDLIRFGEYH